MGKKAGLPADSPNRRTSSAKSVKSRNDRRSRNDGAFDVVGPLAPDQGRRVAKDLGTSTNTVKRVRPDGLGDEDATRLPGGYEGARAHVHTHPGLAIERTGDLIEQIAQGDIPNDLDIPG
jgi:hypothetical protein